MLLIKAPPFLDMAARLTLSLAGGFSIDAVPREERVHLGGGASIVDPDGFSAVDVHPQNIVVLPGS